MTTVKFDQVPTAAEGVTVDKVKDESIKKAWQDYEAKPEYKKFNKHDMIESMLPDEQESKEQKK